MGRGRPRTWADGDLVERNPRLDVDALYRAGSLHAGQISRWACHWLTVQIEAVDDWIVIDGDQRIALAHDEFLNGKYTRTKFLCPACNRGCRMLHARDRTWTCRTCGGFDYQCRHRNRWARGLERLQSLRRRIALGYPLHGKKRKLRKAMLACEGEVIDSVHEFVAKLRNADG